MLTPDQTKDVKPEPTCGFTFWNKASRRWEPCLNPVVSTFDGFVGSNVPICEWHKAVFSKQQGDNNV